jgi:hypothetical protein
MKLVEFQGLTNRPTTGATFELYLDTVTGVLYRWAGSGFAIIALPPVIDEAGAVTGLTDPATGGLVNLGGGSGSGIVSASAGAAVAAGTITVSLYPENLLFCVIRLVQINDNGDENPLGFVVAPPAVFLDPITGYRVSRTFETEPDTVAIKYYTSAKYYAQTVAGIPELVGTLQFPANWGEPLRVEVA